MTGIVWTEKHDSLDGKTQFAQIIENYNQLGIYPVKEKKTKREWYVRFVNHDEWYLANPDDTGRGRSCNVAYIHNDIEVRKINTIILTSIINKPFKGITYYGETH